MSLNSNNFFFEAGVCFSHFSSLLTLQRNSNIFRFCSALFLSLPPSRVGLGGGGHLFGDDLGADLSALELQCPSEGVPELGQLL